MRLLDRGEVLARTDLADLATEVCGLPRGRGRAAHWHCPNPDHPDVHPSMGVYDRGGGQRWKCHACGAGGTAIDLLMISGSLGAGEAIRELGRRAGMDVASSRSSAFRPEAPAVRVPDAAVEEFVASAERLLWEPGAGLAQRTLRERGFPEALLRANRVGFDPGPARLPRRAGLPRRSAGIVFPVLDVSGRAVYYQVRSLSPRHAADRKYDQPTVQIAPNPQIAGIRGVGQAVSGMLVIAEGIPDGLTAACAGVRSVAVLGVSHAGEDNVGALARKILADHPAERYAVCFDPDPAGVTAGARLADRLARHGASIATLAARQDRRDLNAWWQADADALIGELRRTAAAQLLVWNLLE
jgi:DNA primase